MEKTGRRSFGGRKTPERPDMSPISVYSDVNSVRSTSSALNPVRIATRVFGNCFAPPEARSSKFERDLDVSKAPSGIPLMIFFQIAKKKGENLEFDPFFGFLETLVRKGLRSQVVEFLRFYRKFPCLLMLSFCLNFQFFFFSFRHRKEKLS